MKYIQQFRKRAAFMQNCPFQFKFYYYLYKKGSKYIDYQNQKLIENK